MEEAHKSKFSVRGVDYIWVNVDRVTKCTHFMPIIKSISTKKWSDIYTTEVVVRHKISVSMVCDRDVFFTSKS